jgi:hypothetical protein
MTHASLWDMPSTMLDDQKADFAMAVDEGRLYPLALHCMYADADQE